MTDPVVESQYVAAGVLQITMQDRHYKNGFSQGLVDGLGESFDKVRQDSGCKAVIITGYDTYFCSGGTEEGLLMLQGARAKFSDFNLYNLALECSVPVIAAMQGHGIGGGFVFGLFADFVVLSRESVYTLNFMRYGFTPGMGATYIAPRKLGTALAHELLLGARNYRGAELERRGIPYPVLPRAQVQTYAVQLATELAAMPRVSLVTLKDHLVSEIRQQLPATIERELLMHEKTFHLPEVRNRITALFGR
jgi:polyketide biosynthesis enoyl-CoA hydratase PksI